MYARINKQKGRQDPKEYQGFYILAPGALNGNFGVGKIKVCTRKSWMV